MSKIDENMGAARLMVRHKTPYFRSALVGLIPVEESREEFWAAAGFPSGKGSMCVSQDLVLRYYPPFVERQSPATLAFLLAHEIMHVVSKHVSRRGSRHPQMWNYAGDLAINPAVREMGFTPPTDEDEGAFPETFNMKPGLSADEYYELLRKQSQKEQDKRDKQAHAGHGNCGTCSGGDNKNPPDKDAEGRTQAQVERLIANTCKEIQEAARSKSQGIVPAGLLRMAEEMLAPPKVNWRAKLSRALRAACEWRPGSVVYRYDGPSRRQAGIGFGEGCAVLPRLRQPVPRVAIVADTSGSMSERQMGAGLREANGIVRSVGGLVTFLACDAAVHALKPCKDVHEMCKLLKGGGGSSFIPAFEELQRMRFPPEVAVLFTDGMISVPDRAPKGMRVIWLLTGKGRQAPTKAYGEAIELDDVE